MKLLFFGLLVGCFVTQAGVIVAPNKASALQNCQEKADASPKILREEMLSSCLCVVEQTDFGLAEKLSQENKTRELHQLYQQANDICVSMVK